MTQKLRHNRGIDAVAGPELDARPGSSAGPRPPRLGTARVRLRPLTARDYSFLYHLALSEETAYRWRYRGATPSPDDFQQQLWRNVLAQFIVEAAGSKWQPVGHVAAFDPSHRDRWVHLAAVGVPSVVGTGAMAEAACLLVDYLFTHWAFEKIYLSVVEYNLAQFDSGLGCVLREEGRLRRHCFFGGRFWDMVLCAVFRDDWTGDWRSTLRGAVPVGEAVSDGEAVPTNGDGQARAAMDLDEFTRTLRGALALASSPAPDDRLVDDLDFDSLQFVLAFDLLCQWSGHGDLPDAAGELPVTVRDLYLLYCTVCQMPAQPPALLPTAGVPGAAGRLGRRENAH